MILAAAAIVPQAPAAAQSTPPIVTAGNARCIKVAVVPAASRLDVVNSCNEVIGFYFCNQSIYETFRAPSCSGVGAERRQSYNSLQLKPKQSTTFSYDPRGRLDYLVRECPSGYRTGLGDQSNFPCRR